MKMGMERGGIISTG